MFADPDVLPDRTDREMWDARESWAPPLPDAVDLVVETQSMMSIPTAQHYVRVDAMRCEALADTIAVTVPVLTLLDRTSRRPRPGCQGSSIDQRQHVTATGSRDGYASVEGVGPIPIERAKELCGAAEGWMRILTHPETGIVLSVGRDQYRPPPALRRLVRWRAETCMAPGCNVPASRCQIDHNIAWEHGGSTALDNLLPFCQGHRTVKHHGRWHIEQLEGTGGAVQWTSPTGRRYRVDPECRTPTFAPTGEPPPL